MAAQFFNIDSAGAFVFRNNTFHNIRRFGILIDSRDGLIENNRFEATSSNGVVIHNDSDWPEGSDWHFPCGQRIGAREPDRGRSRTGARRDSGERGLQGGGRAR